MDKVARTLAKMTQVKKRQSVWILHSISGGPLVFKNANDDGVTPGQNYELIGDLSVFYSFISRCCELWGGMCSSR